jgi:hypothetical protein
LNPESVSTILGDEPHNVYGWRINLLMLTFSNNPMAVIRTTIEEPP